MGNDYNTTYSNVNQHFRLPRELGLYTTYMWVHMEVKNNLVN